MASADSGDLVNRALQRPAVRRIVPHVFAALALAVFVSAGNWQYDRMRQKQELARQAAAAESAPPVALPAGVVDWAPWRFRVVEAVGRFDGPRQLLLDNRVYRGRVGYHVITPLITDDGRALLVNRGWVAAGATRAERPSVPPPQGEMRVRGRINIPTARYLELGTPGPPRDGVWQNLDPSRIANLTGLPVLEVVLEQTEGVEDGLVRDWPRPDTVSDKHRGYMVQWYAFAAIAIGLWGWFTFRRQRASS